MRGIPDFFRRSLVRRVCAGLAILWLTVAGAALAADGEAPSRPGAEKPKRLLLIGQSPDGHPFSTHEYMAGMRLMARLLQSHAGVQCVATNADEPWKEGPELLDGADGAVVFVSQGAEWLSHDPQRLAAFQALAKRGGGLSVVHWGMGTKDAKNIPAFVSLFGGCHGGPDRKFQIVTAKTTLPNPKHPIVTAIQPFEVEEEFYYALKFPGADSQVALDDARVTSLVRATIDGKKETVSWGWERPDGGRSFGFTGLHYHKNWERPEYRRLMVQGVLWTLRQSIPREGIPVDVPASALAIEPRGAEDR